MGFSVRMAPGIRVRVSSRGVRTSVGPRVARLHVGGGAPSFSSGAGPVTFSTRLGTSPRSAPGARTTFAASAASVSRDAQIEQLREFYRRLDGLHRESFTDAERPIVPAARPVDEAVVHQRYREAHLRGVSVFARARRKQAVADAGVAATEALAQERAASERDRAESQRSLDELWHRLTHNDSPVVLATLRAAFGDNEAAAAPLEVSGSEATLLVVVPSASTMPAKKPAQTPTGRPTIKSLLKKEAADWHRAAVSGCALVTVKEAFAVAPGLESARVVAVTLPEASSAQQEPAVLLTALIQRARMAQIRWSEVDAWRAIASTSTELQVREVGVTRALAPLDLSGEPQLTALLQQFEFGDLDDA